MPESKEIHVDTPFDREQQNQMTFSLTCSLESHKRSRNVIVIVRDVNDNGPYIKLRDQVVKEEHINIHLDKTNKEKVG